MMEFGTVREDATGGEEGIIDDGVGHCKRGRYGRGGRPGEMMELGTVREDATGGEEGIIDDGVGHCKRGCYGRGRRHNR